MELKPDISDPTLLHYVKATSAELKLQNYNVPLGLSY